MDDLVPYLEPTIPDYIWYACFGFVSVVALLAVRFCVSRRNAFRWVVFSVLLAYMALVYSNTVFLRDAMEEAKYELKLFWSYCLQEDGSRHYMENLLNVVLFVPIGVLCGCLSGKVRWWMVLLFAFGISASIETLQLVMKRGIFEFDDQLHNTLGAMVGYVMCVIVAKELSFAKLKKRK